MTTIASTRRGACPGLSTPMQTGDGLLARLAVSRDISLDQAEGLCAAARAHGNGVIEVTARGSIQFRGLSPASTAPFAEAVAALNLDAGDGIPILTDPLAGLVPPPAVDGRDIAARLRRALAAAPFAASLGAKVSVVIDGGAALHLDAIAADIRLRTDGARWHVAIAGDADTAQPLGWVNTAGAVEISMRLLRTIAQRGPSTRAKDLREEHETDVFAAAMADLIGADGAAGSSPPPCGEGSGVGVLSAQLRDKSAPLPIPPPQGGRERLGARPRAEPIGKHALQDHTVALGVGLAFGHTKGRALAQMIEAARSAGACALRTAPARAVLFIGVSRDTADALAANADRLGFITRPNDPRRHVAACAGAPICASAEIPARGLAPRITAAAAPLLDGSLTLHLSGCRKGCAHPAGSALTIVGSERGCELVIDGTSRGETHAVVAINELADALARIADAVAQTSGEGSAAAALARLGPVQIARLFGTARGIAHG